MRFCDTPLAGVVLIEPDVHRDARGFFVETFHADKYQRAGIPGIFLQDNHSFSVQGTLRGLHLQLRKPQGKLVRVTHGEIWDVAVDLRPDSRTFGRWTAAVLTADQFNQLYVPPGCAHGFCVLSATAHVQYKCTEVYDPADEAGIAYNDPELDIRWPIDKPLLSLRDAGHKGLQDFVKRRMALGAVSP
jgi:dTDP-4-dehydrorhamnose 3,5-epimerase